MKLNEQIDQLKKKAPRTAGDMVQDDMYAMLHSKFKSPADKKEGDK